AKIWNQLVLRCGSKLALQESKAVPSSVAQRLWWARARCEDSLNCVRRPLTAQCLSSGEVSAVFARWDTRVHTSLVHRLRALVLRANDLVRSLSTHDRALDSTTQALLTDCEPHSQTNPLCRKTERGD